jgi:hypothetical protein
MQKDLRRGLLTLTTCFKLPEKEANVSGSPHPGAVPRDWVSHSISTNRNRAAMSRTKQGSLLKHQLRASDLTSTADCSRLILGPATTPNSISSWLPVVGKHQEPN